MENKLQELTDKLYNEGLAKGKKDADNLLSQAKEQAEEIMARAKAQAESIVAAARKEADDLKVRVEGDIKMASSQSLAALRSKIENMIEAGAVGSKVDEALSDKKFVGSLISTVASAFKADGSTADLEVILPSQMKSKLNDFLAGSIDAELAKSLSFSFSDSIGGGFRIAPKGKGYYIDFSDESFKELLGGYLRPATTKILFG